VLSERYLKNPRTGVPLEARIRHLVRAHDVFFADFPVFALLFHQVRGLVQLKPQVVPELRGAVRGYLDVIASHLFPAGEEPDPGEKTALEAATAVAGAIAGYRSYSLASGRPADSLVAEEMVVGGVMQLVARNK
jgi:hypothetical protein